MSRSRFVRRSLPAMLFAVVLTACGSSTSTPAVDAKQVQQRLDQFVATVTQPASGGEFTAKADGAAKVETQSDGTVAGTLPRLTFTSKDGNVAVLDPITIRFLRSRLSSLEERGGGGIVQPSLSNDSATLIDSGISAAEGATATKTVSTG